MTVEELTRLRAKLYECGGEYLVVKNTLARIALTDVCMIPLRTCSRKTAASP